MFSFGFLKFLRIKGTSILDLYFFEIFGNPRTYCSGVFFFSLIQNQKNLWLQAFEKNSKNQEGYEMVPAVQGRLLDWFFGLFRTMVTYQKPIL
jgi:hypothetical protein